MHTIIIIIIMGSGISKNVESVLFRVGKSVALDVVSSEFKMYKCSNQQVFQISLWEIDQLEQSKNINDNINPLWIWIVWWWLFIF